MRAVVFDFDGVLVDSEPLHFESLRDCLLEQGISIDEEEYRDRFLSYDDREAIRIALEGRGEPCDPDRLERIAQRKHELFARVIADVELMPGARELIASLQVPLAIASGAVRGEIETILDATGIRHAFTAVVGADDVSRGKPHPEPYRAAVASLVPGVPGLTAEQCLAFEDSVAGIASARAAGLKVFAVTTSYPPERLGGAHRILDGLTGLDGNEARRLFEEH